MDGTTTALLVVLILLLAGYYYTQVLSKVPGGAGTAPQPSPKPSPKPAPAPAPAPTPGPVPAQLTPGAPCNNGWPCMQLSNGRWLPVQEPKSGTQIIANYNGKVASCGGNPGNHDFPIDYERIGWESSGTCTKPCACRLLVTAPGTGRGVGLTNTGLTGVFNRRWLPYDSAGNVDFSLKCGGVWSKNQAGAYGWTKSGC